MDSANQIYPVVWQNDRVLLIDQTRLPQEYARIEISRYEDMARAIKTMIVRGAPAIGIAAAYGMYLGAREIQVLDRQAFLDQLEAIADELRKTRPTAVNLFWAIDQMLKISRTTIGSVEQIQKALLETAKAIQSEDVKTCQAIGEHGVKVLPQAPEKLNILTHCNAGSLATGGYGTALGVIRSAWQGNRLARVYADETRPRLQGARLTTWECVQEKIPVTLISDNMAAHCMKRGLIHGVIVGADRIAANGDTANKIGTYGLALVAQAHQIPFFVAAPLSTIDFSLESGEGIVIEERDPEELYQIGNTRLCPEGVEFYNPAFDVTPAALITSIITELGAVSPESLKRLKK
ncbi:MAG: S-methyl-5-thioribose-1-phosphate isomerase [Microcoleaceae cyanobacterium]